MYEWKEVAPATLPRIGLRSVVPKTKQYFCFVYSYCRQVAAGVPRMRMPGVVARGDAGFQNKNFVGPADQNLNPRQGALFVQGL